MTVDIFNLVKESKIFSSLDDETLRIVIQKFKKIALKKHKILFHQGDLSDGLYILLQGRLIGLLKTQYHHDKFIGDIEPGQTIGELGAISHEPRAATAKAVKDSILLKLSTDEFTQLCEAYPPLLMATMRSLTARSRSLIQLLETHEPEKKHIVMLPGNKDTALTLLSAKLQVMLKKHPDIGLISEYDAECQAKTLSASKLNPYLNALQNKHKKMIYLLGLEETALATHSLEKADMVYVVVNGDGVPHLSQKALKIMHKVDLAYKAQPALILLHEQEKHFPRHTSAWLKLGKFGLHHHIRVDQEKDWQRLMRFISGTAVGVVLGGGGVRSWAHIGALKALEEEGVPIDIIGGTSAGSIVGGYYALRETYKDAHGKLRLLSEVTHKSVSLWNLTWPAVSLFNGKTYTETQKNIFGDVKIEDLWLPFFCITCDLSKSTQVINRIGPLWKKIRASTSVPGIFPPVVTRGRLRLDGGIVNNLPVDIMKKRFSNVGTVIAVQLIHNIKDDQKYNFPPVLPFWQTILTKLGFINKGYRFPHFVETFLRSLLVGSSVKQRECAEAADVLVSPDLSDYNLLSVTIAEEHQLIDAGYNAAIKEIKKWKKKQ